jgi:DNA-binding PadR family transcriptional regulator
LTSVGFSGAGTQPLDYSGDRNKYFDRRKRSFDHRYPVARKKLMDSTALPLTPLTMALLLALAEGDAHGYALMQGVKQRTSGRLSPGTGSLYAALDRLMDDGLIEEARGRPGPEEDQRRRYFRITKAGRRLARAEAERMLEVVEDARRAHLLPARQGKTA